MSERKRRLIKIIAAILLVVGAYKWTYPTYSWHQKMTLEVEIGGEIYSGSSVSKMKVVARPNLLPDAGVRTLSTQGEAVVLELPGPKYLFALLKYKKRSLGPFYARDVFEPSMGSEIFRGPGERWARNISRMREKRNVPTDLYPLLVTFTDITDPSSVKRVEPDDLESHFGAGVKLKAVTLEITGEKVTKGRVENFVFMKKLKIQSTLSGLTKFDENSPDPINYLTDKAFIAGDK